MKVFKIIIYLILMVGSIAAQNTTMQFQNISALQGLSDVRAKCIYQDSYGYLWFGTWGGGLNRYDGYSFQSYVHEPEDSTSIIHNVIFNISEDSESNLWIATRNGISHYIRKKDKFINYDLIEKFKDLSYNEVYEAFTDSKNRIWFGTRGLGAVIYNTEKDIFIPIRQKTVDSIDISPQIYGDFSEDKKGIIWASAGASGLVWFDEGSKVFRAAEMDSSSRKLLEERHVFRVYADSENNIWVMTTTDLYKYFPTKKELVHLLDYEIAAPINGGYEGEMWEDLEGNMWIVHINLPHPLQFPNLSNEYLEFDSPNIRATDFYIDSFGTIWISDGRNGLYKHVPTRQSFHNSESKIETNKWLKDIWISAICQSTTDTNIIYLGTPTPGWISYNKNNGNIIEHHTDKTKYITDENTFYANNDGTVWIGYWGNGLAKWNVYTDEFVSYFSDSLVTPNLHNARIGPIEKDLTGALWIGTYNGLFRLSPDESKLDSILVTQGVTAIYPDGDFLWIGTHGAGLLKYDINKNSFLTFENNRTSNSLSNNIVWDIHKDKDGFLWLATKEGLNRFDPVSEFFEVFNESDGLANDFIASILHEDNDDLWVSTAGGISRLYKDSLNRIGFANFDSKEGLSNIDFRWTDAYKDDNGRIYLGGRGLQYFTPRNTKSNPPRIHITDFTVNGKPFLKSKGNIPEELGKNNANVELKYDQNTISIGYIALHSVESEKNQYAHFLEGYDPDWILDKNRQAFYLNLDPGTYKFHLRGTNSDGVWNSEDLVLSIIINPPWWNTWLAYIFYISLLFSFLYGVRRFELNRQRENENKRLLKAENQRKSEELEEARQLQLSMLPKELPKLPNLDIAVYMKTATEVGGDYYDFHVGIDGTLTVVLGDATGHGMRAGTVVTAAKSLFNSYASNTDILFSFKEISRCIKQLHLQNLSMCLTMLKIRNNKLILSSAGMPPLFFYQKETNIVEEYQLEGMPLGTINQFPYKLKEKELHRGDTILLMSDGFPELMNYEKEMFGYKRARNLFEEVSGESPENIISKLKDSSSEWTNDKDPDDDVTFVVIKVK